MKRVLFFAIFFCSCHYSEKQKVDMSNNNSLDSLKPPPPTELKRNQPHSDEPCYVIIPYDSTMKDVFGFGVSITLKANDFKLIDSLLKIQINSFNIQQEKEFLTLKESDPKFKSDLSNWIIDLKNYNRQYVAIINSNSEKEVWVNCFCWSWGENEIYKHQILDVNDGGKCFFQLKINLSKRKVYDFSVNGSA